MTLPNTDIDLDRLRSGIKLVVRYDLKGKDVRNVYKSSLIILFSLLMILLATPEPLQAQWPPFRFFLLPQHEKDRITYQIDFKDQVDWIMTDLTIKIPLPEGTRFLEAQAIPTIETGFDGEEVTIFMPVAHRHIKPGDVSFIVEVIDPNLTAITARPWIAWQGDQPGDYLTEPVTVDITGPSLVWEAPADSQLELKARASVADGVITYYVYPRNVGRRMWDVKVNIPVPEGTTFLSAEGPPTFVSNFNGQEVSFSTIELPQRILIEPLILRVSAPETATASVSTHAWATWKNTGRKVGRTIASQEETRTGDIIVQSYTSQQVVLDATGDVPFSNYDLNNVALQEVMIGEGEQALKVIFHINGRLGPVGDPLSYLLYIDQDCRSDTGQPKRRLGVEYEIRYRHKQGSADVNLWDQRQKEWVRQGRIRYDTTNGKMIVLWAPHKLLGNSRQFCWVAIAVNGMTTFGSSPPFEQVPERPDPRFNRYQAITTVATSELTHETFVDEPSAGTFIGLGDLWRYWPGWSEPPASWQAVDSFDDGDWFSGATGLGFGQGKFATDLSQVISSARSQQSPALVQQDDPQSGMTLALLPTGDDVTSVYMRRTFTVDDPTALTQLILEVDYMGGFVTYLNGVEVARRGLGEPGSAISYDTVASNSETQLPAWFDLGNYVSTLRAGPNVLAIQAHRPAAEATLFMAPTLTWASNPADLVPPEETGPTVSTPAVSLFSTASLTGKLAVPLDNGRVAYNIHIFSVPDGEELLTIPDARQPNFRFDGQQLLINREGGGVENLFEYDFKDRTEKRVSDAPQDWHPFYDPWGNRVVYGNAELIIGQPGWVLDEQGELIPSTGRQPFIFVQCSLLPPHEETDPRCRNIASLGVLIPAGQVGEIQGTHPVWTSNDMIAYKGCNTWAGSGLCGIYIVPSASTKGFSDGFIPRQLTSGTSDIPSDTKGNLIAFTSHQDGDWEAYIMDLNGENVRNLSNSPTSNDGIPTISPEGTAVAFVSDRDGQWAVWVTSLQGGAAQKLFDLPVEIPWGDRGRAWINERISWGP